jgi:hypothetical protein
LFVSENGVATGGAAQFGYGGLQVRNNFIYLNEDGANTVQMYLRTASSEPAIQVATNHPFKIQTNNQERLRITSDGKLGLGTSTVNNEFVVRKDSASDATTVNMWNGNTTGFGGAKLRFGFGTGDSQIAYIDNRYFNDGSGNKWWMTLAAQDGFKFVRDVVGTPTEVLTIDSSGRVGIGTTTVGAKLHIEDAGANAAKLRIAFDSTRYYDIFRDSTVNGLLNFYGSQTGFTGYVFGGVDGERVRIDPSGRLLVGASTSPSASQGALSNLVVQGYVGQPTSGGIMSLQRGQASASIANDQLIGRINFNGSDGYSFADITARSDAAAGAGSYPGNIAFSTTADGASSPTARMTIKNDGKVGIGTESPALKLHAEDSTQQIVRWTRTGVGAGSLDVDASGNAVLNAHTTSTGIAFHIQASEKARLDSSGRLLVGTGSTIGNVRAVFSGWGAQPTQQGIVRVQRGSLPTSGQTIADIEFADDSNNLGGNVTAVADANWTSGTSHPSRLVFSTTAAGASSPTERMRISSNGDVNVPGTFYAKYNAVFTWNTSAGIKAVGDGNTNTGGVGIETTTASTATRYHVSISNPNGVVGSISTNGSATAYNTSSDYRLKENVVPLTGAADRVNQLQVHRFNFIADPGKTVDGFIAHEAQAVVPEAVTGTHNEVDDDGNPVYQGIDQSKLVPLLTAALQEALAEIESLKARVTALEP